MQDNIITEKNKVEYTKQLVKNIFTEDHALDEFEAKSKQLNKEPDFNKQLVIVKQMQEIAKNLSGLKGWPYNARVFWDSEAAQWPERVEQKYMVFIKKELVSIVNKNKLNSNCTILELGTGNMPYFENAINLDISYEMLYTNPKSIKKIQANVEHSLPLKNNSCDTIIAVFLCNYLERLDIMLAECKRVLKENGKLIIVQSATEVDNYHSMLEKHPAKESSLILRTIMNELGFKTEISVKDCDKKTLMFVEGIKI